MKTRVFVLAIFLLKGNNCAPDGSSKSNFADDKGASVRAKVLGELGDHGHQMDSGLKEKRCNDLDFLVGSIRKPKLSLPLTLRRRDVQETFQKKQCETCRATKCKSESRCESCNLWCKDIPLHVKTRATNNIVQMAPKMGESSSDVGLEESEDRYYTIGSFGPGPVQSLLAKLLNVPKNNKLDRLVVLAKNKSKFPHGIPHPVIIDTAHVFSVNDGQPSELELELHTVQNLDEADIQTMTSKLDKALDAAIETKKKLKGQSHLTPEEIDKIIDHTAVQQAKKLNPLVPGRNDIVGAKLVNESGTPSNVDATSMKNTTPPEELPVSENQEETTQNDAPHEALEANMHQNKFIVSSQLAQEGDKKTSEGKFEATTNHSQEDTKKEHKLNSGTHLNDQPRIDVAVVNGTENNSDIVATKLKKKKKKSKDKFRMNDSLQDDRTNPGTIPQEQNQAEIMFDDLKARFTEPTYTNNPQHYNLPMPFHPSQYLNPQLSHENRNNEGEYQGNYVPVNSYVPQSYDSPPTQNIAQKPNYIPATNNQYYPDNTHVEQPVHFQQPEATQNHYENIPSYTENAQKPYYINVPAKPTVIPATDNHYSADTSQSQYPVHFQQPSAQNHYETPQNVHSYTDDQNYQMPEQPNQHVNQFYEQNSYVPNGYNEQQFPETGQFDYPSYEGIGDEDQLPFHSLVDHNSEPDTYVLGAVKTEKPTTIKPNIDVKKEPVLGESWYKEEYDKLKDWVQKNLEQSKDNIPDFTVGETEKIANPVLGKKNILADSKLQKEARNGDVSLKPKSEEHPSIEQQDNQKDNETVACSLEEPMYLNPINSYGNGYRNNEDGTPKNPLLANLDKLLHPHHSRKSGNILDNIDNLLHPNKKTSIESSNNDEDSQTYNQDQFVSPQFQQNNPAGFSHNRNMDPGQDLNTEDNEEDSRMGEFEAPQFNQQSNPAGFPHIHKHKTDPNFDAMMHPQNLRGSADKFNSNRFMVDDDPSVLTSTHRETTEKIQPGFKEFHVISGDNRKFPEDGSNFETNRNENPSSSLRFEGQNVQPPEDRKFRGQISDIAPASHSWENANLAQRRMGNEEQENFENTRNLDMSQFVSIPYRIPMNARQQMHLSSSAPSAHNLDNFDTILRNSEARQVVDENVQEDFPKINPKNYTIKPVELPTNATEGIPKFFNPDNPDVDVNKFFNTPGIGEQFPEVIPKSNTIKPLELPNNATEMIPPFIRPNGTEIDVNLFHNMPGRGEEFPTMDPKPTTKPVEINGNSGMQEEFPVITPKNYTLKPVVPKTEEEFPKIAPKNYTLNTPTNSPENSFQDSHINNFHNLPGRGEEFPKNFPENKALRPVEFPVNATEEVPAFFNEDDPTSHINKIHNMPGKGEEFPSVIPENMTIKHLELPIDAPEGIPEFFNPDDPTSHINKMHNMPGKGEEFPEVIPKDFTIKPVEFPSSVPLSENFDSQIDHFNKVHDAPSGNEDFPRIIPKNYTLKPNMPKPIPPVHSAKDLMNRLHNTPGIGEEFPGVIPENKTLKPAELPVNATEGIPAFFNPEAANKNEMHNMPGKGEEFPGIIPKNMTIRPVELPGNATERAPAFFNPDKPDTDVNRFHNMPGRGEELIVPQNGGVKPVELPAGTPERIPQFFNPDNQLRRSNNDFVNTPDFSGYIPQREFMYHSPENMQNYRQDFNSNARDAGVPEIGQRFQRPNHEHNVNRASVPYWQDSYLGQKQPPNENSATKQNFAEEIPNFDQDSSSINNQFSRNSPSEDKINQYISRQVNSDQVLSRENNQFGPSKSEDNVNQFISRQAENDDQDFEMVGSPGPQDNFNRYDYTGFGKLVPHSFTDRNIHHRDVTDQQNQQKLYFVGDNMKIPLYLMKNDDGTMNLKMDVSTLCKCNTNECTKKPSLNVQDERTSEIVKRSPILLPLDERMYEYMKDKVTTRNQDDDGPVTSHYRHNLDDKMRTLTNDIKKYCANEEDIEENIMAHNEQGLDNSVQKRVGLLRNVLSWMKNIAMDDSKKNY